MTIASEQINHWLKEIDSSLSLNNQGKVFISSESGVEIVIASLNDSGHVLINSDIRTIPEANKQHLFAKALELNLYQDKTMGGSISVDPVSNKMCLSFTQQVEFLDSTLFQNTLQNIITLTNDLKSLLSGLELDDSPTNADRSTGTSNSPNALFV